MALLLFSDSIRPFVQRGLRARKRGRRAKWMGLRAIWRYLKNRVVKCAIKEGIKRICLSKWAKIDQTYLNKLYEYAAHAAEGL